MLPRPGCTVVAKATLFDEDVDDRWSRQQFGDEWDTSYINGEVRRVNLDGRLRVWFPLDKTAYTFDPTHVSHDATTCPACLARSQEESSLAPGEGSGAARASRGPSEAGSAEPRDPAPTGPRSVQGTTTQALCVRIPR